MSGFAGAVVVAVLALLLANPVVRMGPYAAGPTLLLSWIVVAALGARRMQSPHLGKWLTASALGGLITSALLLIFLGALLVTPTVADAASAPEGRAVGELRPQAPLMVVGFLALGAAVGVAGGVVGRFAGTPKGRTWSWPARLALVTMGGALPLILLGGLVTSTESGMAVPDWPGSYGMNMVLFPLGLMAQPRIFLEHSHRLFGMLVGVCTIATALSVQFSGEGRRAPGAARAAAWGCLVLVVVQGVLGGTRVTENSVGLAVVHGVVAQLFLALLGCLCAMLLPAWRERPAVRAGVARMAAIVLGLFVVQLAMGATFRHLGTRGWHALATHVGLAFVLVVMAPILGARMGKGGDATAGIPDPAPAAKRIGKGLMHATGLQFLLGWGALVGAMMAKDRGAVPLHDQLASAQSVPLWEVVLTTAHQANGALLLVLVALAFVWTRRRRATSGGAPATA